jgi:hypothetical protein
MDWHIIILRSLIILFLLSIAWALGSALYYLLKPGAANSNMSKALTVRISLSVILFLIIVGGAYLGFFQLHLL